MTLDQWLEWLLHLMEQSPEGWKQHCWHRAKELAKRPGLEQLPDRLESAMRARVTPTPSTPEGE